MIRAIEPQDRTQVERLLSSEIPQCPGLAVVLAEPSVFGLVDAAGEEIRGVLAVALCDGPWQRGAPLRLFGRAEVLALAVAPEHRRQGIGHALMEAAHRFAEETCARSIDAQIGAANWPIQGLLAGLGWRPVEIDGTTYPDGQRAVRVSAAVGG